METVQLQCGHCGKVMAISVEHLGGQVRCPHCLSVVQTPPRQTSASGPAPAPIEIVPPKIEPWEVESIFSAEAPSEDVFDAGPQKPLVEMPVDVPPPVAAHAPQPSPLFAEAPAAPETPSAESDAAGLAALRRSRPIFDKSYGAFIALVFFVPYSVISTGIIAYLLFLLSRGGAPLEDLPDPAPKGGAQKVSRVKHDQPLVDQQKVALGGTTRVGGPKGGLEVRPTKVIFHKGDETFLELHLLVKNVTDDQVINPMDPEFLKIPEGKNPPMPYTFLDSGSFKRIYRARLAYQRSGAEDLSLEAKLKPGEQATLVLTTQPPDKGTVENIAKSSENLTWRVQLRRGLVNNVSRTAVIGVQFNAKDIEKGG